MVAAGLCGAFPLIFLFFLHYMWDMLCAGICGLISSIPMILLALGRPTVVVIMYTRFSDQTPQNLSA